ncbi:MAG: hypothetical protein GTN98_15290 [Woeseiaceae bacterium]|nr:hypothetical protein [Woeseiaceae bacterium]
MRKLLFNMMIVIAASSATAYADQYINNHENLPVPSRPGGGDFSLQEVQMLISKGCSERRWTPILEREGLITCSIIVRGRHFAKVKIPFTTSAYSILYLESDNLDYDPTRQTIHRNYNKWVINLSQMIVRQFRDAAREEPDDLLASGVSIGKEDDRYEALLKLGDLRDKGVISEEEFQAEKAKLLEQTD